MNALADSPFCLGEWTVRPRENAIERDGDTKTIEPKLMEVLVFLAQEPARVHLRQEILDSVWQDTFVTDEVLTNAVWELRRALGDDAREPRYIRTIPRKGYGLVATVEPLTERQEEPATPSVGSSSKIARSLERRKSPRQPFLLALGLVLLTGVGLGWWFFESHGSDSSWPSSVVVLPIESLSSDPTHQHFADALTDTLTAELAASKGFDVSSRSTVVELSAAGVPAVEIARQLGADAFLEGTLSFSTSGRARLSSQLIDRRRDRHLWSELLEDDIRDRLGAERRLSRRVVIRLLRTRRTEDGAGEPTETPPNTILMASSTPSEEGGGWSFRTGGEVWSDPTLVAGDLLIGSNDGNLYSLDPRTGTEIWRLSTPGAVRDAIAAGESDAYLATGSYAFAVDAATGIERWRRRMSLISPMAYDSFHGGILVAGAYDRHVYALDPRSGKVLWRVATRGETWSAAAFSAGRALVGTDQGEVIRVDLAAGLREMEVAVDSAVVGGVLTPEGDSYVATSRGYLYRLAEDGSETWRRSLGSFLSVAPLLHQGILYQGVGDGSLLAIDRVDGSVLWTFEALNGIATTPRIDGDQLLVGSLDHRIYALDLTDGAERWSYATGGWVVTRPLVVDDLVVFGSLDGTVYGLPTTGPRSPPRAANWPKPGDPRVISAGAGPELLWRRSLEPPANLAVSGDTVVLTTDKRLAAFAVEDGEPVWSIAVPDGFGRAPVVAGDRVIAATREGTVLAIDLETGSEWWRQELGVPTLALPVVSGDRIYLGDRTSYLNALDLDTGSLVWRSPTHEAINGGVIVVDDRVIVGSCGESVWAFDPQDGERLWKTHAGECVVTDGVRFENTVIFGSFNGDLLALEAENGVRRWTFGADGEGIWYRPLILEGVVYFGSGDYHVYALDAATGHEIWRFRTDNRALTEITYSDDLILFGSHDRHLYAVDRESGEERWRLETTRDVQNVVAVDDRLYFLGDEGYLFAYRL